MQLCMYVVLYYLSLVKAYKLTQLVSNKFGLDVWSRYKLSFVNKAVAIVIQPYHVIVVMVVHYQ